MRLEKGTNPRKVAPSRSNQIHEDDSILRERMRSKALFGPFEKPGDDEEVGLGVGWGGGEELPDGLCGVGGGENRGLGGAGHDWREKEEEKRRVDRRKRQETTRDCQKEKEKKRVQISAPRSCRYELHRQRTTKHRFPVLGDE